VIIINSIVIFFSIIGLITICYLIDEEIKAYVIEKKGLSKNFVYVKQYHFKVKNKWRIIKSNKYFRIQRIYYKLIWIDLPRWLYLENLTKLPYFKELSNSNCIYTSELDAWKSLDALIEELETSYETTHCSNKIMITGDNEESARAQLTTMTIIKNIKN